MNRKLFDKIKRGVFITTLLTFAVFPTFAQAVEIRHIVTYKVATFEQQLQELAQQGFRLEKLFEAPAVMSQAAILTRQAGVTAPKFEYLMLGTKRLATLEKELEAAAAQGYEVRGAMIAALPYVGTDVILVLERPAGEATPRYSYTLLSTTLGKEDNFSENLLKAVTAGFRPVKVLQNLDMGIGIFVGVNRSANLIVMARPLAGAAASDSPALDYQTLQTRRIATLEKELKQAAEQGFSLHLSSPSRLVLLARSQAQSKPKAEYKFLKLRKAAETEHELMTQAQQSFFYRAHVFGDSGAHLLLEKTQQPKPTEAMPEYKVLKLPLKQKDQEQFQKEIAQVLSAGFTVLDFVGLDKLLLVRYSRTS